MISQVLSLAVGNALKVYFEQASDSTLTIILRNTTGTFSGYNDSTAVSVFTGTNVTCIIDTDVNLANATTYYYGQFDYIGSSWVAANVVSGVPESTYFDQSVDVLSIVRDRIDAGIKNEILLVTLTPTSSNIPVLNSPPMFEDTRVSVVLAN